MSTGYYICLGDKTDCGGQVLEGDETISWDGLIHALEGHLVSCGKDGKAYRIYGGDPTFTNMGRRVAGTLDSFSGCPCRAQLIPSVFTATYEGEPSPALQASRTSAQPPAPTPTGTVCDERFQLLNHRRLPFGSLNYALLQNDQCIAYGKLDERGHSSAHGSTSPASLKIATGAPSPALE